MMALISEDQREAIVGELIKIPMSSPHVNIALKTLTELCRKTLGSRACTLVWVDLEQCVLTQVACAGLDDEFEHFMAQNKIKIGALQEGVFIDYDVLARGEVIRKSNLAIDGGGIANPEVAKKYKIQSALCYPLKVDDRVVGFLNHFSANIEVFSPEEESWLQIFAVQAENLIKLFSSQLSLAINKKLVADLLALSPDEFLRQLPNRISQLIPDAVCVVWKLDFFQKTLRIVTASDSVDEEYRRIELDYSDIKSLAHGKKAKYLSDVIASKNYKHKAEAKARGWISLLTVPLWVDDDLIGLLDIYTKFKHHFSEPEKEAVEDFANLAALSIQKADLLSETGETFTRHRRQESTIQAMTSMAASRNVDKVLSTLVRKSLEFVGVKWGWVRRVNSRGELAVTAKMGTADTPPPLAYPKGITWKAIIEKRPQLANDITSDEWKEWYSEFSKDTKSELAIPLLNERVRVYEGTSIQLRSQPVGVLNLESPQVGAFSSQHISYVLPLARQAAFLIDRFEAEQKLGRLREVEREIVGKKNWRDVLQIVVRAISDTLDFDHVNVSLVDTTHNLIKSEYVVGIPENEIEPFKKMAVHTLDSSDIQADIVKNGKVEVPSATDPRYDADIYDRFGHKDLIRVFIPMKVPATGEVIGTVEAGYRRGYREYIYETDIQFLQSFVAYAVEAIEPSKRTLVETISHELRSSIVGIRSNADYLRLLWRGLTAQRIENKLNDTLLDCEILLLNVGELDYFLGRTPQAPKIERIWVIKDIVIKTVTQLRPLVSERNFDHRRIDLSEASPLRIRIYAERAKLNQVVYNLLLNAIKYAEDDPSDFRIKISIDERSDMFVLRFADWGMGIEKGLEEKVFDYEFRTPEARAKNVTGSGLGLTIARGRMREMGGDLIIASNANPTEFHVMIPKKLMEEGK